LHKESDCAGAYQAEHPRRRDLVEPLSSTGTREKAVSVLFRSGPERTKPAAVGWSISSSTYARYCTFEAELNERMEKQRRMRLLHVAGASPQDISFIQNPRLPQRWTDE
jgi:hypothetical protein